MEFSCRPVLYIKEQSPDAKVWAYCKMYLISTFVLNKQVEVGLFCFFEVGRYPTNFNTIH